MKRRVDGKRKWEWKWKWKKRRQKKKEEKEKSCRRRPGTTDPSCCRHTHRPSRRGRQSHRPIQRARTCPGRGTFAEPFQPWGSRRTTRRSARRSPSAMPLPMPMMVHRAGLNLYPVSPVPPPRRHAVGVRSVSFRSLVLRGRGRQT